MERARVLTTDHEIDRWLAEPRNMPPSPVAQRVEYLKPQRILLLYMSDGRRLPLPVEELEELAQATDEQLSHFHIEGGGFLVHFPDFDGNLDVQFLAEGGRGGPEWIQALERRRAAALRTAA